MEKKKDEHPAVKFFKSLYEHCDEANLNLRFLHKDGDPTKTVQKFLSISKIDTVPKILEKYQRQYHCYFGVATRTKNDGSKEGIRQIPAVWVDIDFKKFSNEKKAEIRQRYKDFPLKPSYVIHTGGGIHAYWKSKEPASASKEQINQVEDLNKRLASYFDGDKGAIDASRILRTPGTINHKYPSSVILKNFNSNKYDPSDFDFLPEIEGTNVEEKPRLTEGWEKELLKGVPEGERNASIVRLAGRYLGKGLSRDEILPILLNANSRFDPPLDVGEVETCLNSISKTHQRNASDNQPTNYQPSFQRERLSWPSPLTEHALHGLAGEFVKMIEPQTEADPAALLIQILTATGNIIGANPFFQVEADKHYLKLFPVLVGETSKGRKGTSLGYMKHIFRQIDLGWALGCIKSGLSSGEGLIWQVRDEIKKREPIREKSRVTGEYQEYVFDPGIEDKRLLVIEAEFASTLRVIERDGNTLSPTIRQAWDSGDLATLTKNSPAVATGAHISIIGHITRDELKRYLDRTEIANGFANRFIFTCVKRSKELPEGGGLYGLNLELIQKRFKEAIEFGKTVGEIRKDGKAMQIWSEIYPGLSAGKPGLFGAVVSRSEAQVMRIACIYAVLDKSNWIRAEHLLAALALWDYSEASARYIFGDATGDVVADRILQAIRGSTNGLTRTDIRDLFFRNISGVKIDDALCFLESHSLLRMARENTGGRPIERWVVV